MPVLKPSADLEFLDRVDRLWRDGEYQETIASSEGISNAGTLHLRLARLGFRFERRNGGPRIVTTLDGRDYAAMRDAGEIVAAEEPVAA